MPPSSSRSKPSGSPGIPGSWGRSSSGVSGSCGCSAIDEVIPRCNLPEAEHGQLRGRPAQERADEEQLVGVLWRKGGGRSAGLGHPCLELERGPGTPRKGADGRHPAVRDEECAAPALLDGRDEQTDLGGAQALQLREACDHVLEGGDSVSQPRGVLVAQRL